jgi:hypothetical protein
MREYNGHCQPLQGSYFGRSLSPHTTTSTFSNVRRRFDKFSNNNDYEDVSEFSVLARNQSEAKSDNGDNENPDQNSVAGTCSDQVFVDHILIIIIIGELVKPTSDI